MSEEVSASSLNEAFDHFYATLDATTVAVEQGRRVDGMAQAIALSEATSSLWQAAYELRRCLDEVHGTPITEVEGALSGSPEDFPPEILEGTIVEVSADPLLFAAVQSIYLATGNQPENRSQRWFADDVISSQDLDRLDAVRRLLSLRLDEVARQNDPGDEKIAEGDGLKKYADDASNGKYISADAVLQKLDEAGLSLKKRTLAKHRTPGERKTKVFDKHWMKFRPVEGQNESAEYDEGTVDASIERRKNGKNGSRRKSKKRDN